MTDTVTIDTSHKPLSGKVAIVTGAGRRKGMGWAAAIKLAQQGAILVVTDIGRKREDLEIPGLLKVGDDFDTLEQLVSEIEAQGTKAMAIAVDITDPSQINACVKRTCETFGGIDILFNITGVAVPVAGGLAPGL